MKKKLPSLSRLALTPVAGFLFAALLFTSCSKNEMDDLSPVPAGNATNTTGIPTENNGKYIATGSQSRPPISIDEMISISHGECFGRCPDYSITVSKEGVVVYNGIRNVGVLGRVVYNINPDLATELALNMERGGFFGFEDQYNMVPDAQRNETSLYLNGRLKVVVDYGSAIPAELREMRTAVEKAVNVNRFINGTADPAMPNTK